MLKLGSMRAPVAAMLALGMTLAAAPAPAQQYAAETPGTALSRYIRVLASKPARLQRADRRGPGGARAGRRPGGGRLFRPGRGGQSQRPRRQGRAGRGDGAYGRCRRRHLLFQPGEPARRAADDHRRSTGAWRATCRATSARAQADYRLAISSLGSDEARRRLALSLAIGRDRKAALDAIQPLLNRRDPAAQRTRAFVLALVGDQVGAAQAIEAVMPGGVGAVRALLPLSAQSQRARRRRRRSTSAFSRTMPRRGSRRGVGRATAAQARGRHAVRHTLRPSSQRRAARAATDSSMACRRTRHGVPEHRIGGAVRQPVPSAHTCAPASPCRRPKSRPHPRLLACRRRVAPRRRNPIRRRPRPRLEADFETDAEAAIPPRRCRRDSRPRAI